MAKFETLFQKVTSEQNDVLINFLSYNYVKYIYILLEDIYTLLVQGLSGVMAFTANG